MSEPLFVARFPVVAHQIKKNNRPIFKAGGRHFLGKSAGLARAEAFMQRKIHEARLAHKIDKPISIPIQATFIFHFTDFLTKKREQRKTLPDLSNLVQLPEDCLQAAGVIENDSLIMSLDGSRRIQATGNSNYLEIIITEFKE